MSDSSERNKFYFCVWKYNILADNKYYVTECGYNLGEGVINNDFKFCSYCGGNLILSKKGQS